MRLVWMSLGERLNRSARRAGERVGVVACLRFHVLPRENSVWLGHLEIHADFQRMGIGRQIVWALEKAAQMQGFAGILTLSRRRTIGFGQRLGYEAESDPRYFWKTASSIDM